VCAASVGFTALCTCAVRNESAPRQEIRNMHNTATLLCIDDEPDALEVRRILLERAGYRVLASSSPAQGIRLFSTEAVDLIVLDYWMADMRGIALAEKLKAIKPKVPIVMLSGFRSIGDEAIGRVDRWLVKGEIGPDDLLAAIRELLTQKQTT
jgi:CheY-like chemotaxis protein